MKTLVVLMIEPEQPDKLSARKLIAETMKHNVLAAYSAKSGIDLLRRFPNVDAVLVHASLLERTPRLLKELRELHAQIPLILASPGAQENPPEATHLLDSHRPDELVRLLMEDLQN